MQVYDNILIHDTRLEVENTTEDVNAYIARITFRKQRQYVVERETAINLILGLCESNVVPVSADIGANDFLGTAYLSPSDTQTLSGRSSQISQAINSLLEAYDCKAQILENMSDVVNFSSKKYI